MVSGSASVPARAALAGNPSDGYGGAVLSMVVPELSATATLRSPCGNQPSRLVDATINRCVRDLGIPEGVEVDVTSNIPRSVGLAGSSAIVIAVISALDTAFGLTLDPDTVAAIAYRVEREDLEIAGGWQDQVIQSRATTGLMEFGETIDHRTLEVPHGPPIPMFVAWREGDAEPSGLRHATLQARRHSPTVVAVMAELAETARSAASAIETRDVHALKEAIGHSFALRCQVMDVARRHRDAVERTRNNGAAANVAGSGGAVVGVMPKDAQAFADAMNSDGFEMLSCGLG